MHQLNTSNEGNKGEQVEGGFSFEYWININGLQSIKKLFIKHKATTKSALTITSPQFKAFLTDPELLQQPHLLPNIMDAIQKIPSASNPIQKTVVLTHLEDKAMNNAKTECEKIFDDMHRFQKLIKNSNVNYKKTETKINNEFDKMVRTLKQRQKQLLKKLEDTRNHKIQSFEQRIDILKVYGKHYNDLQIKWDRMIRDKNYMDTENRALLIQKDATTTIKQAQTFQSENKDIFWTINDKYIVTFEKTQLHLFGDVYGDNDIPTPNISSLEIYGRSAIFDVNMKYKNHDEKIDETNYFYHVEYCSFNDDNKDKDDIDEKCEWKVKRFKSIPFELEDLSQNTEYQVRCKVKFKGRVFSRLSKTFSFATMNDQS